MEYSPMMILILWLLTPSDCSPFLVNETQAVVQEVPRPSSTVQNSQDYQLPGYFTFNDGKPFLVEKDPLTGALDFNLKTTPVNSFNSKYPVGSTDDYFYDEDEDYPKESIERKDGNIGTANDIKDPSNQSDLHKFLNLPVHYSTHGKYPLISSSYANTKVQGHGSSSYSNHKTYSSTSTSVPPTYYPLSTTPKPTTTTSTTVRTTAKTTTSTTTEANLNSHSYLQSYTDYEYVDYDYDKLEPEAEQKVTTKPPVTNINKANTQPPSQVFTSKPNTTTTPSTTPTNHVLSAKTNSSIRFPEPFQENSTDMHKESHIQVNNTSVIKNSSTEVKVQNITNAHSYKNINDQALLSNEDGAKATSEIKRNLTTGIHNTSTQNHHVGATKIDIQTSSVSNNIVFPESTNSNDNTNKHKVLPKEPAPQASESKLSPESVSILGVNHKPHNTNSGTNVLQQSYGNIHNKSSNPESARLNATNLHQAHNNNYSNTYEHHYYQKFNKSNTSQTSKPTASQDKDIIDLRPPSQNYPGFRPSRPDSNLFVQPDYIKGSHHSIPHESTNFESLKVDSQRVEIGDSEVKKTERPNLVHSSAAHINTGGNNKNDMFVQVQPERRPQVPPEKNTQTYHTPFYPPAEHHTQYPQPTKVDNHFIRVSPGQVGPTYSLQTSFSIGVPPSDNAYVKETPRPGQGVGQVLFPDEEPFVKPEEVKRPVGWSSERPTVSVSHPPPPSFPSARPFRLPPRPQLSDIHTPPHPNENYPRPQWESHLKPPQFFNPTNNLQKVDVSTSHSHQPLKRIKPQSNMQRHDLPNILPQFRPNAKIGHGEYHAHFSGPVMKPREPLDTLQPPPLPRPQHLRLNRNEEQDNGNKFENFPESTQLPLVHRRTGPQAGSHVTTLQMMQQNPPRRGIVRSEYKDRQSSTEKEEPVFVVYPSNGGNKNIVSSNDGVVVVGTRGPQRPLSPDSLGLEENIDLFPLDDNKHFPLHARDRIDTPILKTKATSKPVIKNDFPYPLVKPTEIIETEEKVNVGNTVTKEYTAFSPTEHTTEEIKDHDSEINLIPYLQDYMPFATKKTIVKPVEVSSWNMDGSTLRPISVTLNTKLGTMGKIDIGEKATLDDSKSSTVPSQEELISGANTKYPAITANHRPIDPSYEPSEGPQPQDFQAPFHASLSAPSQGWTIVSTQKPKEAEPEGSEISTEKPTEETKFDIENFKPQLFGGFKPILPPVLNEQLERKTEEMEEGFF